MVIQPRLAILVDSCGSTSYHAHNVCKATVLWILCVILLDASASVERTPAGRVEAKEGAGAKIVDFLSASLTHWLIPSGARHW